jgi:hypothetical protein
MAEHSENSISPFLVSNASEGAEKTLIKMTAALSCLKGCILLFSFSSVRQSLSKPSSSVNLTGHPPLEKYDSLCLARFGVDKVAKHIS